MFGQDLNDKKFFDRLSVELGFESATAFSNYLKFGEVTAPVRGR